MHPARSIKGNHVSPRVYAAPTVLTGTKRASETQIKVPYLEGSSAHQTYLQEPSVHQRRRSRYPTYREQARVRDTDQGTLPTETKRVSETQIKVPYLEGPSTRQRRRSRYPTYENQASVRDADQSILPTGNQASVRDADQGTLPTGIKLASETRIKVPYLQEPS